MLLFENLTNKNKGIQSDCIKAIYKIGVLKPALIANYTNELISLLDSKNNRLQWGAMMALNTITNESPKRVYSSLIKIIAAAEKGSVIANDHCVSILIKLCVIKQYAEDGFSLLNERLLISPTNQLPRYAKKALPIITDKNKAVFINTLTLRLGEIEKDTKRLRIEKIIKNAARVQCP